MKNTKTTAITSPGPEWDINTATAFGVACGTYCYWLTIDEVAPLKPHECADCVAVEGTHFSDVLQAALLPVLPDGKADYDHETFAYGCYRTALYLTMRTLTNAHFTRHPSVPTLDEIAELFGYAFALYQHERIKHYHGGLSNEKEERFDCIVAEESDLYGAFIPELTDMSEMNGQGAIPYDVFHESLVRHATDLLNAHVDWRQSIQR